MPRRRGPVAPPQRTPQRKKNAARAMKAARRFSSPPDGVASAPVTRVEHDATMTAQNL
ncbi:hypothetical protein CF647_09410 [Burkholderia sp. 117]|nr:hypothetical protein CF647_09410 [Burkholderia sp. 117]